MDWHKYIISKASQQSDKYEIAGPYVDGLLVRDSVPNLSSIDASIPNPVELPGIREVPMSYFTLDEAPLATDQRTLELAEEIKQSGEINPLIVAVDSEGPYIIEGGHRYDALKILRKKSFPAIVVLDDNTEMTQKLAQPTGVTRVRRMGPGGRLLPPEPVEQSLPKLEKGTPVRCGHQLYLGQVWSDNGTIVTAFVYANPTSDKTTLMEFPRNKVEVLTTALLSLEEGDVGRVRGMGTQTFTYQSDNHDGTITVLSDVDGRSMTPKLDKFVMI